LTLEGEPGAATLEDKMTKFTTTLVQSGKTATGIVVPHAIVEALDAGKKPAVTVTLNGYTYRNSIASMGGKSMISVSAEVRDRAQVKGGDTVEVELALDTAPREVEVPAPAALGASPTADAVFNGLSYSNRLRLVLAINDARTEDTRLRRIARTVANLADGKA
jgi:hypothetical protein